jgi:hypothetical protein
MLCILHECRQPAAVNIEQKYRDGSKVVLPLCRPCATKWLRERPKSSRNLGPVKRESPT